MKKLTIAATIVISLGLMGCSGHGALSYNTQPVVMDKDENYDTAYQECLGFADEATGSKVAARRNGALLGVGLGAVAGAATGEGVAKGAALGGATGAVSGGLAGRSKDLNDADYVVRNCLEKKGYTVLDKRDD